MQPSKISCEFVESCIRCFKSILHHKHRHSRQQQYSHDKALDQSIYDQAKEHETKTRNLKKALSLYAKAATNGEKLNSCIKDFASVLHQSGFTNYAIQFLQDMKPVYRGDKQKYQKLIKNLTTQLRPTGKHDYKNILIDLVDVRFQIPTKEVLQMFSNSTRIREIYCFQDLGFSRKSEKGRYIVLQFDSFSAAKKTLETFKQQQWFGINKFWMDFQFNIVSEACDGKIDFQNGFLLNKGQIEKISGKHVNEYQINIKVPNFYELFGYEGLQLRNQTSSYLIQNFPSFMNQKENMME